MSPSQRKTRILVNKSQLNGLNPCAFILFHVNQHVAVYSDHTHNRMNVMTHVIDVIMFFTENVILFSPHNVFTIMIHAIVITFINNVVHQIWI